MTVIGRVLAALLFLAVLPVHAGAQETGGAQESGFSIVVVDVERILQEASAIQAARTQMQGIQADFQKRIQDEETRLRATEQDLQQQQSLLAPEVFSQRLQEFRREAAELDSRVRKFRRTMDEGFDRTLQEVQVLLLEEVDKIAREHDANLVLSRSQFILARNVTDITDDALNRLNERVTPEMVKIEIVGTEP